MILLHRPKHHTKLAKHYHRALHRNPRIPCRPVDLTVRTDLVGKLIRPQVLHFHQDDTCDALQMMGTTALHNMIIERLITVDHEIARNGQERLHALKRIGETSTARMVFL